MVWNDGPVKRKLGSCLLSSLLIAIPAWAANYAGPVEKLLNDANKLFDEGKYASARMQYVEALRLEPNCPEAYNGLGLCAQREGNFEESDGCYLNAIKIDSQRYDALYNLANNYYVEASMEKFPEKKLEKYTQAISYYLRARKAFEKKYRKPVGADFLTSIANVYRDRARMLEGLARAEEMKQALELYHKAIKENPNYPQAHAELGRAYLDGNQFAAAEKELRSAIALNSNYAYPYYNLGKLYAKKKEYPAALVAFHNSLKHEIRDAYKRDTLKEMVDLGVPESAVDHFAQGYEEMNAGNWENAINEFESAAGLAPDLKAVALNNVGYAQYRSGKSALTALAIDSFRKAINISPRGLPEAYYNLGEVLLQNKRYAEAEAQFRRCIEEARGNHYLAHNALGIVLSQKGDHNEALNQYNLALLQSGNAVSVIQFNRGLLLEKMGRKAQAIECYKKYLEASPSGLNANAARDRLAHLK